MYYKNIFFLTILLFLTNCTTGNLVNNKPNNVFVDGFINKGFALVYSEKLFKQEIISKKINERSLIIFQKNLKINSQVKITNILNNKTIIATVGKNSNYPLFNNSVLSLRVAEELDLNLDQPYIEIVEILNNSSFVAKKAKTYDEEKNVAIKAPVNSISINDLCRSIPVLGICYGAQMIINNCNGIVEKSDKREYGRATISVIGKDPIFNDISVESSVWMSHGDSIKKTPAHIEILAKTSSIPVAAFKVLGHNFPVYGFQFHPEVTHTIDGKKMLGNFLFSICKCTPSWTPDAFIESTILELKNKILRVSCYNPLKRSNNIVELLNGLLKLYLFNIWKNWRAAASEVECPINKIQYFRVSHLFCKSKKYLFPPPFYASPLQCKPK